MENETIATISVVLCFIGGCFYIRWSEKISIRRALAKEGFATAAVFTEIGGAKTLTATSESGMVLVAKVIKQPEDLNVRIKIAVTAPFWDTYYFMELSDRTFVQAQPV
ncbi:hypothetical protein H6784_03430 [Candidatus Nomurabacteria bacterium]|nr:hypothetical protein [Candidatus Kaiserbacteria bacterium]MCB9811121.1 hypothetical protein [Candidatus Nomurabacteria bacterium]MCB9814443.1 hypothetical protein [Candidatus Nomurabacteria bacterium]